MKQQQRLASPAFWRGLVQWGFLLWTLFLGVQFSLFVRHFESGGAAYLRPPGVEGFLPIGALVSLRYWIDSGHIHPVHPAALVLFLTFIGMSLLARKSFCAWLCPVGTLSEAAADAGKRLFGRNFRAWRWLDTVLRGTKYLLLLFFLKIIVLDMPTAALGGFLDSPYWAISDVKMLHFFTRFSSTTFVVVSVLVVLSLFYRHAWCRYLCPYGALLGLFSLFSPFRIRRNQEICSDCGACSRNCPAHLPVATKSSIGSAECSACLSCLDSCPQPGALHMSPLPNRTFPWWGFAAVVVLLFAAGVGAGMLSGHWQSSLSADDFRRLIPLADRVGH
ncbi:MAG: 4Fe-4S binding protein [Desulfuromonadales bacterium]